MYQSKEVNVIQSSDYNALSFGCLYLIKDIDMSEGYVDVITLQSIYDNYFNINHLQSIDICILMGSDNNQKITKAGFKTTLVEIGSHGKFKNIKYYNEKIINRSMLRQIYICPYSKQKVRWFSLDYLKIINNLT